MPVRWIRQWRAVGIMGRVYPPRHPQQPPYQPPPPPRVVYVQQRSGSGWFTAAGVWILVLFFVGPVLAVMLCCGYALVAGEPEPEPSPSVTSTR